MMDVHTPLTPPAEQRHYDDRLQEQEVQQQQEQDKPSVKFDLSNLPETQASSPPPSSIMKEVEEEETEGEGPPSPCIDISAHMVPDTILVALLDRVQEMRGLVRHNMPFFETLRLHLGAQWPSFEKVLYSDRQHLPDGEWIAKIESYLHQVPCMLGTFKELVGYVNDDDHHPGDTSQVCSGSSSDDAFFNHVNLCHIRSYPEKLRAFRSSYPQFFINCQQVLSEDAMSQLESTLLQPRSRISDHQWKATIRRLLSPHPNLMDQLKEIIAYEIDDE